MTRNIVGNVPEPGELYGRKHFIEHLWRQLDGNNILLLGPRRFGKTGIMNHVLRKPRSGWLPVYLDLEDVDAPQEFVWRLAREILQHDALRRTLQNVRRTPAVMAAWILKHFDEAEFEGGRIKFKQALNDDWQGDAHRMVVELEKAEPRLIFILDELPSMLDKMKARRAADAADFLEWFRKVRLLRKDTLRRHRYIVGGSIGIDVMLRRLKVPAAMNDFERLYVEPLQPAEARLLIADLAGPLHLSFEADVADAVLELIGPAVPYFIHMLFSQLAQLPPAQRQPVSRATLLAVYEDRVLGPTCKHYFDHYRTRLARYGKIQERCALAVLRAIVDRGRASASTLYAIYNTCMKNKGDETRFAELMAELQCDWYVTLDIRTNEYAFMLNVMRDWWRRWYAKPAARPTAARKD